MAGGLSPTPDRPEPGRNDLGTGSRSHSYTMAGGLTAQDHADLSGNMAESSPLSQHASYQNAKFNEEFDLPTRGGSILDGGKRNTLSRANSTKSITSTAVATPSRGGTLKKKASLSRKGSLKRSGSKRLSRGSIPGFDGERGASGETNEANSAFFTPVPTHGTPTVVLAERFEAWRRVLRDLITYFREIHNSYEQRAKGLQKINNVLSNISPPPMLMREGGINDANLVLRQFHVESFNEESRAKDIETGVINQLTGLRGDLKAKIKEIKSLSGDFKNSVDKEMEVTRRAVQALQEALNVASQDPLAVSGKGDPFILRLGVDRQVERQIDEENYLHRAFLNLEGSGRELDSIVVGEIQKAFNALAGILKREGDENYDVVEKLKSGPISLPQDREWSWFVERDENFVDPGLSLRRVTEIEYPGRDHPLAAEVREGMLERKSKYLKSYTPGWYVLTSTHLHEFKSADRIHTQTPVVSLFLPDQKLGTHSQYGSSSHKFMLKGRQTGAMHRGHSWVFRAESHDTMLAWYDDVKALTEKTGLERDAFVRKHARSVSNSSAKYGSDTSDGGFEEDEADAVPFSASASAVTPPAPPQSPVKRPQPGGRFPSDVQVDRGLHAARSTSSASSERDHDIITVMESPEAAAAGTTNAPVHVHRLAEKHSQEYAALLGSGPEDSGVTDTEDPPPIRNHAGGAAAYRQDASHDFTDSDTSPYLPQTALGHARPGALDSHPTSPRHDSLYGEWMGTGLKGTRGKDAQLPPTSAPPDHLAQRHELGSGSPVVAGTETQFFRDDAATAASETSAGNHLHDLSSSEPEHSGSASTVPTTIHQLVMDETTVENGGKASATETPLVENKSTLPPHPLEATPFDPQRPLDFRGRADGTRLVPGAFPRTDSSGTGGTGET